MAIMFELRSLTDEELLFLSQILTVIQQSKCFQSHLPLKEEISAEREKRLQQRKLKEAISAERQKRLQQRNGREAFLPNRSNWRQT